MFPSRMIALETVVETLVYAPVDKEESLCLISTKVQEVCLSVIVQR